MKIRYYIKSFKDSDKISNFERGGYLYIEYFKVNGITNNSNNKGKIDCLYDFKLSRISKASGLFKESKVTHEINVLKDDKSVYILYLKPNIKESIKLYFNNKERTDNLKKQIWKYTEYIIVGVISSVITLAFSYKNNKVKNEENIDTIKRSLKREILDELKDSYLISKDILTIDNNEISKNKVQ